MRYRKRLALIAAPLALIACAQATAATIEVAKSPNCGCCAEWVEYLRINGFTVRVTDTEDLNPVAHRHGVPDELRSCHTATVEGYALEGHVPVADIRRLLAERPQAAGLAVPGMPIGSPGMEQGGMKDPYDVVAFTKGGPTTVYARHR
jgi:hypothetical protein